MLFRKSAYFAAAALSIGLFSQIAHADLAGVVKLDGKAPEMAEITAIKNAPGCPHKDPIYEESVVTGDKGELQNVIVSVKSTADGKPVKGDIPAKPLTLDQKGCQYVPHVGACMVGQEVDVKSEDHCLHNVHTLSIDNDAKNFGQPAPGTKKLEPFTVVETFKVKCDVHPWMNAWIRALDNPYFAVTDEKGAFTLDTKGLADGDYIVVFWQEKYGEKEEKVTIKGGKTEKPLDFTFKAK